jgi:hypothetical protein
MNNNGNNKGDGVVNEMIINAVNNGRICNFGQVKTTHDFLTFFNGTR